MDDLHVVLEGLLCVFEHCIELLGVPVKGLLHSLSVPVPLSPHLELCLEVGEALSDPFHVEDARHALLRITECLEFVLKNRQVQLGHVHGRVSILALANGIGSATTTVITLHLIEILS